MKRMLWSDDGCGARGMVEDGYTCYGIGYNRTRCSDGDGRSVRASGKRQVGAVSFSA